MSYLTEDNEKIEIREKQKKYYAVLRIDREIVYVSDTFHSPAAATMAAEAMSRHYENNRLAASLL